MYMGDRWVSKNLMASTYIWLPLNISGTSVTMKNKEAWVPWGLFGRTWSEPPPTNSYEAENGSLGGEARTIDCIDCSGKKAMGYIGGPENGTVTIARVKTSRVGLSTVRVKYINGDSKARYASVIKNGSEPVRLAFLPTNGGISTSTLITTLTADNTFVFEGINDGWGPDVDKIQLSV
jgi:hypothetical protein